MEGPRATKLKFVEPHIRTQASGELSTLEGPKNPSWSRIPRREVWREQREALRDLDRLKDCSLML